MAGRLTPDTNLLVRATLDDHPAQAEIARRMLADADRVYLTLPALCEFCWVLGAIYKQPRAAVASSLRGLASGENVVVDMAALEAGLSHLESKGDFADGIIAFEGARMGAEEFVSFDRSAVQRSLAIGLAASVPL